jgi:hypothetical protein
MNNSHTRCHGPERRTPAPTPRGPTRLQTRRASLVVALAFLASIFMFGAGSASASLGCTGTRVTGTLRYRDTGGPAPLRFDAVEVWRYRPRHAFGVWGWGVDATTTTNFAGQVDVCLPFMATGEVVAMRVFASNYGATVWPNTAVHSQPFFQDPGEPDGAKIQRTITGPGQPADFSYDFVDAWTPQHYHLAETVRRAFDYADANRAPGEAEPLPPANVQPGAPVVTTSFYNPVTDTLEIINSDVFNDRAVLHEYGHYVHDQIGTFPAIAALHNGCTATDLLGKPINNPDLAFQEGFSNAFADAVERANPAGTFAGAVQVVESPFCSVTTGPGDTVENFVGGALRDLGDTVTPAEPFDTIANRFGTVVSILDRELDGNYHAGIYDVRNAWLARGLPRAAFDAILTGNGIPVPVAPPPSRLVAATSDNVLWVRQPVTSDELWSSVGHAIGVVGMAYLDGNLWAATSDNQLWVRDAFAVNASWQAVGQADNVVAMTASDGKLWAATSDNQLWIRDPVTSDVPWQPVGHANNVVAMTAFP